MASTGLQCVLEAVVPSVFVVFFCFDLWHPLARRFGRSCRAQSHRKSPFSTLSVLIFALTLDVPNFMAYRVGMKSTNIAEFKNHMRKYLSIVEQGEKVQICRRNVPLAMVVPSKGKTTTINKTQLGCGEGSVVINTDLTEPSFPFNDWNMLQPKGSLKNKLRFYDGRMV